MFQVMPDPTAPALAAPRTLSDLIGALQVTHRTLDNLMRAYQRQDLQIKAIERARAALPPDLPDRLAREAGMLYTIRTLDEVRALLKGPMRTQARELARLATFLPVHVWQREVRGFGELGLARIVAECGDLSNYANPAKVWKRMGLAVIDGERQRRVTGGEAIRHGYVARRASIMYNIGESLLKTNDGAYRETYLRRKEIEQQAHPEWAAQRVIDRVTGKPVAAHPKHYHNRARRYMTKLLLKNLWQAWRAAGEVVLVAGDAPMSHEDDELWNE